MEGKPLSGRDRVGKKVQDILGGFSRKTHEPRPAFVPPQTPAPQRDLAAAFETLGTAHRLLQKSSSPTEGAISVPVTEDSRTTAAFTQEMLTSQESLSLSDANVGDVVWWRVEGGYTGFYLVTKACTQSVREDGTPDFEGGEGVIQVMTEKGEITSENTVISGASFGGMVRQKTIAKNIPIVGIFGKDQQDSNSPFPWSRYFTTPAVVDMGIIKAERLQKESNV